jgi:hypothetical protein
LVLSGGNESGERINLTLTEDDMFDLGIQAQTRL